MRRLTVIGVTVVVLAGALAVGWTWRWLDTPVGIEAVDFDIPAGTSFAAVSRRLSEQDIIDHPSVYRWYARLSGLAEQVQAGNYRVLGADSPRTLLEKFVKGDVRLYSFTIVEGWTVRELLAAMHRDPNIANSMTAEDWPRVLETIDPGSENPEGLFLPETYRFPAGTRDVDLLQQARNLMRDALAEEWEARAVGLPISTPYEALILASIIEKETALAEERPRIAGVFVRRLQRGMRLQTDPTVIYGLGDSFDGNLTRAHLRTDTPYNTYTRGGLPPGPIALPGRAAIRAALQPADGTELYFVATGLGDGSHTFSATIEDHEAAVRDYLTRRRNARSNGNSEQ